MTRAITAFLALILVPATVAADVIPSTYADRSDDGLRDEIARQFEKFGLPAGQASVRAAYLTREEARYFGSHPERIQVAGQEVFVVEEYRPLPVEVLFFGGIFLAAGIAGAAYALYHYEDDGHYHVHSW